MNSEKPITVTKSGKSYKQQRNAAIMAAITKIKKEGQAKIDELAKMVREQDILIEMRADEISNLKGLNEKMQIELNKYADANTLLQDELATRN